MEPISAGLAIVGMGMSLFGGLGAAKVSAEQAQISGQIAADDQQINVQKQHQMTLEAGRRNLQQFRQIQQQQALATSRATSQGAQFGSGLAGGLAETESEGLFNVQGVNQNLEIGQNIFGINSDISAKKMQLAALGGQAATDQGIASLGGSIMKAGPTIGAFAQNAYSGLGNSFNLMTKGPSGYGW